MRTATPLSALAVVFLPGAGAGDVIAASERAKSGEYVATGDVRCAQGVGQLFEDCHAAVARSGGSAVVVVTFPSGFARMLTFTDEEFLRGDPTMSGVGTDTDWYLSEDTYHVRVDDQRFKLPKALVFGE